MYLPSYKQIPTDPSEISNGITGQKFCSISGADHAGCRGRRDDSADCCHMLSCKCKQRNACQRPHRQIFFPFSGKPNRAVPPEHKITLLALQTTISPVRTLILRTANPVAILEQPQGHDPVVHFRAILMGLGRQNGLEFGLRSS